MAGHCAARDEASGVQKRVRERLAEKRLIPADTAVVVCGSLARGEWTSGSDLDWTLLVDGPADELHQRIVVKLRELAREMGLNEPGPTGVFGGMASSHDLIHRIGGDQDTNRNTTQRILLLLESLSVGTDSIVRDRVIRGLYRRYLIDDAGYHAPGRLGPRVPRALLNDVVRYWRTMCVDYASKRRERGTKEWGIRNLKLRMSRKLLFSAGLATCLGCKLRPSPDVKSAIDGDEYLAAVTEQLFLLSSRPPLDTLAQCILDFKAITAGATIFAAYNSFLELIGDKDNRKQLENLDPDEAAENPVFQKGKGISQEFQQGLLKLFFDSDVELTKSTQEYGVF